MIGLSYLILGDRGRARPFFDRWAAAWGGGTERQVAELFDALEGRVDRRMFARKLLAFHARSSRDPTSGNLFSGLDIPVLLVLLGEPGLALDYVNRASASTPIDLAWGLLMPSLDPIRCDPRFVATVDRVGVIDTRAARVCTAKS